jgi:hypothetical protein
MDTIYAAVGNLSEINRTLQAISRLSSNFCLPAEKQAGMTGILI